MRTKICCELATGHHGDIDTAMEMAVAAAGAGCDAVKIQYYGPVNPRDPQAVWLDESRLHEDDILRLSQLVHKLGLEFWVSPFDGPRLSWLRAQGGDIDRIKIASSEAHAEWWHGEYRKVISFPWGDLGSRVATSDVIWLTAIPLYPTPLECVLKAVMRQGWSDHTVGLAACQHMISQGAQWIEAHLTLGDGKSRVCAWDKTPEQFKQLREYADAVETMRTGVSQVFRDRWRA